MRYILVNERVPKVNRFCALCCSAIVDTYLRELSTRIKYCGLGCYTEHCMATLQALGGVHAEKTDVRVLRGEPRAPGLPLRGAVLLLPKA